MFPMWGLSCWRRWVEKQGWRRADGNRLKRRSRVLVRKCPRKRMCGNTCMKGCYQLWATAASADPIFDTFSAQGASRAFECISRRSILRHFEFFEKKSSKNSFWLVLGVTGSLGVKKCRPPTQPSFGREYRIRGWEYWKLSWDNWGMGWEHWKLGQECQFFLVFEHSENVH